MLVKTGHITHVELGGSIFFASRNDEETTLERRVHKNRLISLNIQDLGPSSPVSIEVKDRATYATKSARASAARVLLASLFFIMPACVNAGLIGAIGSTIFGLVHEAPIAEESLPRMQNAQTVSLLRAAVHADPNSGKGGGDVLVDEDGVLIPSLGPDGLAGDDNGKNNGGISIYVVKEADDLGHIAEMFDVSVNTIMWANDIKSAKTIQPGDELLILPVSGVRHVVKSGDTLKSIVKKYHSDAKAEDLDAITSEILAYNGLSDTDTISPGMTVIIPGGEVAVPVAAKVAVGGRSAGGATATGGYFAKPLKSYVKTQGIHGYNGVDLAAPSGSAVYASAPGTVIVARGYGWNGGYGNYVVIKHGNGTQTLYAHLSSVGVSAGATVAQGDYIGAVGNTGRSTGNHLHFEVRGAKNPF